MALFCDIKMMVPTEIYIEIIKKIPIDSKQFLLNYLDIVDALNDECSKFNFLLKLFLENFNNRIDIIDLTSSIDTSPVILKLKKYFTIKSFTTPKKEKYILLINDDVLYNYRYEISFKEFFNSEIFRFENLNETSSFLFDIVYCPSLIEYKSNIKNGTNNIKCGYKFRKLFCNGFGQIVVPDLMNFLSFFPSNFTVDNLIIDFNHERILLSKDLLGVLSPVFFNTKDKLCCKENTDGNEFSKEVNPRCKQITLSSVTHLLIDDKIKDIVYFSSLCIPKLSTIDSVGNHEGKSRSHLDVDSVLHIDYGYSSSFMNSKHSYKVIDFVQLHIPNLQDQKFYKNTCSNA